MLQVIVTSVPLLTAPDSMLNIGVATILLPSSVTVSSYPHTEHFLVLVPSDSVVASLFET